MDFRPFSAFQERQESKKASVHAEKGLMTNTPGQPSSPRKIQKPTNIAGHHEQLPYQLVALVEEEERVAARVAKEAMGLVAAQGEPVGEKAMLEAMDLELSPILSGRAGQKESSQAGRELIRVLKTKAEWV